MPIRWLVGLGNPGPRYEWSRHNVGFLVLDRLRRTGAWRGRGLWEEASFPRDEGPVRLIRPLTFMNRSGTALAALFADEGGRPQEMLVVYDDIDLPWGRLRIRARGGPGGHRGMESLVAELGSESFPRLRVGVGAPPVGQPLEEFVLEEVLGPLRTEYEAIVERAASAVLMLLRDGIERAMNLVNPGTWPETAVGDAARGGDGHDGEVEDRDG